MNSEIVILFTKYYRSSCNQQELEEVMYLLENGVGQAEWDEVLAQELTLAVKGDEEVEMDSVEIEALHQKIQITLLSKQHKSIPLYSRKIWQRVASIAALVFLTGIGIYFYTREPELVTFVNTKDVKPGKKGAVLTLSDGKKVYLSEAGQGQVTNESGVAVNKTAKEEIVYSQKSVSSSTVQFNSLSTERGGLYHLVLPDGSKVWLNALSTIKYPTSFVGAKVRRVLLNGEAFFEVRKNAKQPFIVESGQQEVKVLGTQFNINSYADETKIRTTLLEGSVSLKVKLANASKADNEEILLKPKEQSAFSFGSSVKVEVVNTEIVMAWMDNTFMFDEEPIQNVMKMISRWYDLEVVYADPLPTTKFIGSISRSHSLSKVLELLAATGGVRFRVEGKKIYVTN